jgi:hypothetical protein
VFYLIKLTSHDRELCGEGGAASDRVRADRAAIPVHEGRINNARRSMVGTTGRWLSVKNDMAAIHGHRRRASASQGRLANDVTRGIQIQAYEGHLNSNHNSCLKR